MNNENIENLTPEVRTSYKLQGAYVDEQVAKGRHLDEPTRKTARIKEHNNIQTPKMWSESTAETRH